MRRKKQRIKRRYQLRLGGWMYLVVMAFIGTAAFNSQTALLFWAFGLMLGALIITGLLSSLMMRGIRIVRLLPDHAVVDEPMNIRYELTNQNWFLPSFGMVITELDGWKRGKMRGKPHGWVMHLGPRAVVQAEATGYGSKRGGVDFDRIRIVSSFPFGMLRKTLTFTSPSRVVVYPKLYRLKRELLWDIRSIEPAGARRSEDGGGSEEFYGLREYRPGDSIKYIDWKHSARSGKLVSREMTRLTPPKLMVVVDLNRKAWEETESVERAICFAASLVCEAHLDGFEVGMAIEGVPCPVFPPHHSRWHRTRMLHALGELDVMQKGKMPPSSLAIHGAHWVVIHAGDVTQGVGPPKAVHLSQSEMERWRLTFQPLSQLKARPTQPTGQNAEVAAWA